MRAVSFTVPGDPVAKGRPRATTIAGRGRMYTPEKTRSYEAQVKWFAAEAMAGAAPIESACRMTLEIFVRAPASLSKRKRDDALAGRTRPTTKPDTSNALKSIEDAINGIVYVDDKQIVELVAKKFYSDRPRVEVLVEALN